MERALDSRGQSASAAARNMPDNFTTYVGDMLVRRRMRRKQCGCGGKVVGGGGRLIDVAYTYGIVHSPTAVLNADTRFVSEHFTVICLSVVGDTSMPTPFALDRLQACCHMMEVNETAHKTTSPMSPSRLGAHYIARHA